MTGDQEEHARLMQEMTNLRFRLVNAEKQLFELDSVHTQLLDQLEKAEEYIEDLKQAVWDAEHQ